MVHGKYPNFGIGSYWLSNSLLFLLFFLLPTQLGKHFWFSFSYVLGIRIDYLSPTLYLTDVLLLGLACLFVVQKHFFYFSVYRSKFVFVSFVWIFVGLVFAKSPLLILYYLWKFVEIIFFGSIVYHLWKKERQFPKFLQVSIASSVIFESVLGLLQLWSSGSLNGIFYFFGERYYTASTPGIANASINGSLMLRPYATFSHPNVFAGFLLIMIVFLFSFFQRTKRLKEKLLFISAILLGSIALVTTLSRVAIILFSLLVGLGVYVSFRNQKKLLLGIYSSCLFALFWAALTQMSVVSRFLETSPTEEAFVLRSSLLQSAYQMILAHPVIGVGLGNFLVQLPAYQRTVTKILEIQPVHTIFLLLAAETGIFGVFLFGWFLYQTVTRAFSQKHMLAVVLIFLFITVGCFDHYFFTLQQGQLLTGLIFGFSVIPFEKKEKKRYNSSS